MAETRRQAPHQKRHVRPAGVDDSHGVGKVLDGVASAMHHGTRKADVAPAAVHAPKRTRITGAVAAGAAAAAEAAATAAEVAEAAQALHQVRADEFTAWQIRVVGVETSLQVHDHANACAIERLQLIPGLQHTTRGLSVRNIWTHTASVLDVSHVDEQVFVQV